MTHCVRLQALEAKKSAQLKKTYFDWEDWLKNHPNTPYTPIIPLLHGLDKSLALLKSEGFDNVIARHHRCSNEALLFDRNMHWFGGSRVARGCWPGDRPELGWLTTYALEGCAPFKDCRLTS